MTTPLASSLLGLALGLKLDASAGAAGNRCAVEGVSWTPGDNGATELRVRKLEAAALRLAMGSLVLELGGVVVHELVAQLHTEAGVPQLVSVDAASVELIAVKLQGPVTAPSSAAAAAPPAADAWRLDPLGTAAGTIRAKITDAMLLFDADVTVPVRHGQIDFNDATVEHVGPDSRMGVSRLGLYVDAPDGRSYLYQFASAPLAGVEFEQRGALLSPWVSERGKLQLQAFAESMLRQGVAAQGQGLTEQARVLLGRTALSGEVQLGDGLLAAPGLQAELQGRAEGRNAIALHAKAVGQGVTAEVASLSARNAIAKFARGQLRCDQLAASLKLQLVSDGKQLRFALDMASATLTAPRVEPQAPGEPVQASGGG
ncbi:hypothetical protein QTI51_19595 [Variovorax sp. J22G73]|uniref:hypothetical protein n=1 Tax=unclassified Variovorax TaxID=663243 RepID=UPI00257770EA|nr:MULTISPECIES: hypothetical protein [unclassified Variovorax]MDM0005469.1 hypothetical protein [Variovorax sp. J22R203]MDM0099496.1 hypothetical protein [Variovorax sp. J22G73]